MLSKDEFCEYIKEYEDSMYSVAFSILKNDGDAGEAISEAVYRGYKNLNSLKNKKSFKPWILRIVHNTSLELIRKNSRIIPFETIDENIPCDSCDTTEKLTLREAVEKIKQPYRTVIILFYYEDLTTLQIAHITNTNVATVKKQLSRARKMLFEILKEDFSA